VGKARETLAFGELAGERVQRGQSGPVHDERRNLAVPLGVSLARGAFSLRRASAGAGEYTCSQPALLGRELAANARPATLRSSPSPKSATAVRDRAKGASLRRDLARRRRRLIRRLVRSPRIGEQRFS